MCVWSPALPSFRLFHHNCHSGQSFAFQIAYGTIHLSPPFPLALPLRTITHASPEVDYGVQFRYKSVIFISITGATLSLCAGGGHHPFMSLFFFQYAPKNTHTHWMSEGRIFSILSASQGVDSLLTVLPHHSRAMQGGQRTTTIVRMRCVETSFMGSEATSVTPPPSPPKGREVIHLVTMTDTLAR